MASIVERNGSFRITVYNGFDRNGNRKRETTTFTPDPGLTPKKRRKAAENFAREFEEKIQNGTLVSAGKTTLNEFVERWIAEYAQQNLQESTIEDYKDELDNKILPVLGYMKLSEIKPVNLNAMFVAMTKDGARKDGRPGGYAKNSIKKTQDVLSSVLRTATDWEILEKNPMDKVRLVGDNPGDKIEFFTPEQAAAFLNYIEKPYKIRTKGHERVDDTGKKYKVDDYESERELPEQMKILFNLAIYGGLRKGELLALEWSDIDFENGTVNITKSTAVVGGKQIIKEPKTKNSKRVVSIPMSLAQRIRIMKIERMKYRLSVGDYWQGGEWLFIQDNGSQMSYYTPYAIFRRVVSRYNDGRPASQQLPLIPFHGLRHTSATLLIAGQQDAKTVAARLGHAQTSTTMNIYVHALKESDRKAVNAIENVLANEKPRVIASSRP